MGSFVTYQFGTVFISAPAGMNYSELKTNKIKEYGMTESSKQGRRNTLMFASALSLAYAIHAVQDKTLEWTSWGQFLGEWAVAYAVLVTLIGITFALVLKFEKILLSSRADYVSEDGERVKVYLSVCIAVMSLFVTVVQS
jgi:magnesium-transporting ATPase (P-type)